MSWGGFYRALCECGKLMMLVSEQLCSLLLGSIALCTELLVDMKKEASEVFGIDVYDEKLLYNKILLTIIYKCWLFTLI